MAAKLKPTYLREKQLKPLSAAVLTLNTSVAIHPITGEVA